MRTAQAGGRPYQLAGSASAPPLKADIPGAPASDIGGGTDVRTASRFRRKLTHMRHSILRHTITFSMPRTEPRMMEPLAVSAW
jgi:hypothetical protein